MNNIPFAISEKQHSCATTWTFGEILLLTPKRDPGGIIDGPDISNLEDGKRLCWLPALVP